MPDILAKFQIRRRVTPQTPEQYVALQVARALQDEEHAADYLVAASHFPLATILVAYRVLQAYGPPRERASHHFRTVLLNLQGRGISNTQAQIVSFRVERRAVAVAVLSGLSIDLLRVRELPSDLKYTDASALTFIRRTIEEFPGCMVCFEDVPPETDTRQAELHERAIGTVREIGSPLWLVSKAELIESFAAPGFRSRTQFREAVEGIWPHVVLRCPNRVSLDALGLGLLIQAKRLLDQEAVDEVPTCEN